MRRLIAGLFTATSLSGGALYGADQKVNPYEDKGTHFELPIKADIVQGERVEIAKDKAAMTLKGWNDEYAITITPQIPAPSFGADKAIDRPFTTEADRPLLSKKMEYRSGDVTAFIEPRSDTEFDIDFTLHSKPDTNVFTYKIEGADEFDWFYQPQLTPQEIAEGAARPENVVGSYAVYHKTKANHRIGSTNYTTGKAFHVYRPKAIDANTAETWAELRYADGVLSVTVPQEWLEKAAYPVRVDPTFGYESIGATTNLSLENAIRGSYFTATEAGNVNKLTAYITGTASHNQKAAMYNFVSITSANNKVDDSSTIVATTAAWYDFDLNDAAFIAGTYWLFAWSFSTTGSSVMYADTVADGGGAISTVYGAWPSTVAPNDNNVRHSIYATYTAAASPPIPDSGIIWFD